ncbi:MAG TPA: serine/threonine-protein kinase [Gemmataceae bacterium]|jgi:serine/threonine-protein kinase|nr:serine/threonine-protein kinase [Gemmataceae bacterium]
MPLDTIDSLVDALRTRPILRPEQTQELLTKYAPATADTQELARTLIRLRWITLYQAKKLVSGKADELVVGQYVIQDKLGEGGMGRVYKAVQLSLNRVVALKVVRTSLLKNETAMKRFKREVRSAAQLTHPNIVRVFDADQINDRHFLAMEFIDGVDLGKLVKDRGRLPVPMACSYTRQAALGLQHAHDQNMVHRDIKPSNLLVAVNEKGQYQVRNVVKILDMGLARIQVDDGNTEQISSELTRTGTVVGTPDFMSPEQAKNSSAVDHRSDIYSLGCTFYFLLTGEAPFPKGNPLEKLLQHQMDAPRPIQFLRPDVPNELATIIHCLLAKKPDDRFQSGAALAHALEPWCAAAANSAIQPTMVLSAEAVDPTSVTLETDPNDVFDFGEEEEPPQVRPPTVRRSAPLPRTQGPAPQPKGAYRPWLVLAAVFLIFLLVGAIGVGLYKGRGKKAEDPPPSPGNQEPPKGDPSKVIPKTKAELPPAKELEAVDKYLPNDTALAAVLDIKQLQASPIARKVLLGPIADELLPFRTAFGIDLPALVERAVIGLRSDDRGGALVILQGKSLISNKLLDSLRALAGRNVSTAWEGGPEISAVGKGPSFLATSETCLFVSTRRELIVEALEKRESKRTTKFEDATVSRSFALLSRPALAETMFGRTAGVQLVLGLRQRWENDLPAAAKINSIAGIVAFDERGMHLHVLADEAESGKALEFLKGFGNGLESLSKSLDAPDQRLERIGQLLAKTTAALSANKKLTHLHANIPTGQLETWFAPFDRAK